MSTSDLDIDTLLTRALPEFHRLALSAESLNRRLLLADEANLQVAQASQRRRAKIRARASLVKLTCRGPEPENEDSETLLGKALAIIGKREGLEFRKPDVIGESEPMLRDFCEASGVRARRVRLTVEDGWWLGDSGAMLAFRRVDK